MQISTENIKGKELGIVCGSYVASRVFYKDFFANVRNFFGWEVKEYTEMVNDAREKAILRMTEKAESLGANAICGVKFMTNQITPRTTEILVYGTAVK